MEPLRSAAERLQFCDTYFCAVNTEITYQTDNYREYLLPLDIDKELTDRPFFWLWAEKTGQEIKPTTLRLAFSQEACERENERLKSEALKEIENKNLSPVEKMFFRPPTAELINLGCFRLEKIYSSIDKRGQFACVVPKSTLPGQKIVPWLCLNGIVTCRCDSVEQEWFSIGVCLCNNQTMEHFYDTVKRIPMQSVDSRSLLSCASCSIQEAVRLAKRYVERMVRNRPHDWAVEATLRLREELQQIETYYHSIMPDVPDGEKPLVLAELKRKQNELRERSEPKIEIELRQLALVGLIEK